MKPDWQEKLPFFIDPKLRSFDKDLFRSVSLDLESKGIPWVEDLSLLPEPGLLSSTFLLVSDTTLEPSIRKEDKTLVFGSANMSIFGKREFSGENFFMNSEKDWKNFFARMPEIYGPGVDKAEADLLEQSLANFRSLVKRGAQRNFTAQASAFEILEEELFGALEMSHVWEVLPKLTKDLLGRSFELVTSGQAFGKGGKTLPFQAADSLFLWWEAEAEEELVLRLYSILEDILARDTGTAGKAGHLEDMQNIVSELPIPLALFNKNTELVLHNTAFIRLNLSAKNVLALQDGQQFNLDGELYRSKLEILPESDFFLYVFIPVREFLGQESSSSSEELGIISSSIAHELNNPLGGISGALDVLLLDEHPEEIEQRLREMKAGVSRCKKLVETFLGFSKLDATKTAGQTTSLESCLGSAMELIRFRLIENNVGIETEFEQKKPFKRSFNPHVMSMTIYLMLGDLLTSFGHQKLVVRERSAVFQVSFRVEESSLVFSTPEKLGLGKDFLESKLLNHLLDIQNLKVESSAEEIKLCAD